MAESYITRKVISGGGGGGNYSSWVVEDVNNKKYEVYNGYDFATNPTASNTNLTFNQWIFNNSTTGLTVLNSVSMSSGFYNGPNTVFNVGKIELIDAGLGGTSGFSTGWTLDNSFYYIGQFRNLLKINRQTKIIVGQTSQELSQNSTSPATVFVDNDFVYVGTESDNAQRRRIHKYWKSNLTYITSTFNAITAANSASTNTTIFANNYFFFPFQNAATRYILRVHASNLVNAGFITLNNSVSVSGNYGLHANNGSLYVSLTGGAAGINQVQRYNVANLALLATGVNFTTFFGTFAPVKMTVSGDTLYTITSGGISEQSIRYFNSTTLTYLGGISFPGYASDEQNRGLEANDSFLYCYSYSFVQSPSLGGRLRKFFLPNRTLAGTYRDLTMLDIGKFVFENNNIITGVSPLFILSDGTFDNDIKAVNYINTVKVGE
jgi:hypothetical protein